LWLLFNDKEKVPQPDISTQHVFDEGHRIGELAKVLFPEGVDISGEDFIGNLNKTRELLSSKRPYLGQLLTRTVTYWTPLA